MGALDKAAIRRATNAAHKAVERLAASALADIQALYRSAAGDIAAQIRAYAGSDDRLTLVELRSLLSQVELRLQQLTQERGALLNATLEQAAKLGVEVFTGAASGEATLRATDGALRFVRNFVAEDGLQLSDRVWRIDRGARDIVTNGIEQAIIEQQSAAQAARDLLARGEAVAAEIQDKLDAANAPRLARATADRLTAGTGTPMDHAMRLMRTELNRAHGEAYMAAGVDHPDFAGWRFLLSPAHPKPDICDLLARQNLYGLGPGVYPSREKCPWPAHPNTLSFVEIVFKDEIGESDRAGKQTPMQALAGLSDTQRVGVLGKGKAEIYDDGKMRQGMIRSRLGAVRSRTSRR